MRARLLAGESDYAGADPKNADTFRRDFHNLSFSNELN